MERKPVILGAESAAAEAAERARLTAGPTRPSPLQDKAYDVERGDCVLTRLTSSPLDAEIDALLRSWRVSGMDEREAFRRSLSLTDNYTLIQFAKRMAVRALNHPHEQALELGLTALAAIDEQRIDLRDVSWARGLLDHAGGDERDSSAEAERAASLATTGIAEILRRSGSTLAEWGYREIRTDTGIGLIRSGWSNYGPTVDLARVAEQICEQVLAESYVCEIEVATELPDVWFDSSRRDDAKGVLARARGITAIRGDLRRAAGDGTSQMFVVWLAEMPSPDDCEQLVGDAGNGAAHFGRYVAAVAAGRLFALLVAGSAQIGVSPYESLPTLTAFAERTRAVLSAQSL